MLTLTTNNTIDVENPNQTFNLNQVGNIGDGGGTGDMTKAVYDPQAIEADVFDRTNHTGEQAISTVTNLQTELDSKLDSNNYTINSITNGVITGGRLSVNVDPTKFDITDGSGVIVDSYTDPLNPVVYPVSWTGLTAQTVTNIGTQTITHVFIDKFGAVYQSPTVNADLRRDYIYLGSLGHTNLTTIGAAVPLPDVQIGSLAKFRDFVNAVGVINYGNVISANGANLSINKSAGTLTRNGANFYNDNKNPNEIAIASATAPTFRYRTQTGAGSTTNLIDPTNYDLNGIITAIGSTKATNQRVYLNTVGNIVIQYGQTLYNSLSAAVAGIQNSNFIIYPNLVEAGFILIGVITVMSNATALNNSNQAIFTRVSKFGESTGSTAGLSTTTLQQAYNNSSEPEILTDPTRGAVTVRRGSASDTDNVWEIQNNAGLSNVTVTGDGTITVTGQIKVNTPSAPEKLAVLSTDESNSAIGFVGQETNKGTVKITHNKPTGSDSSAAGLSIALAGVGTACQGIFLDSASGTTGNLMILRNSGSNRFVVDSNGVLTNNIAIRSTGTNNDALLVTASDGSRLARLVETSGGHGWFEVDNATGVATALFRADGGSNYLNAGDTGFGTTSPTSKVDINASNGYTALRSRVAYTPTSSADANGATGQISWDENYVYVKTAGGWKRSALTAF